MRFPDGASHMTLLLLLSLAWKSSSLHCLAVLPTWQYCLYPPVWQRYEINRFRSLSHALVHFVIDRASLFNDQRTSSLPIRAKYKTFRTIWQHTCDNSPQDFIDAGSRYFCRVVESYCLLTRNVAPHISSHDPPCHKTMKKYEDFEGMVISLLLPRKFAIRTWFCNCPQYLGFFTVSLSTSQEHMIKETCWFSQFGFFIEYFPHRINVMFLSS